VGPSRAASRTGGELLAAFGQDPNWVRFVPGGGVFGVSVDGETVRDREIHGDGADADAITDTLEARLEAG
jgi:predicted Rdx family selenoprotein